MGSGLSGGPLTGGPAYNGIAPAGQSNILAGPLGAGASDVVTKIGSTVADASVNTTAKLTSLRTGIGATETEKLWVFKDGTVGSASGVFRGASTSNGLLTIDDVSGSVLRFSTYALSLASGIFIFSDSVLGNMVLISATTGRVDIRGTDFSASPGAQTIDKPSGKAAIALGASSVVITNNTVTAASRVMITPQTRDATCKELICVPGAGSFTVSGSANATAALVFSFEVNNIL